MTPPHTLPTASLVSPYHLAPFDTLYLIVIVVYCLPASNRLEAPMGPGSLSVHHILCAVAVPGP